MGQKQKILQHLNDYGSITSWDAIQNYRITRLGALIFNLKQEGYTIKATYEHNKTSHWVRYSLVSKETLLVMPERKT